MRYRNMKEKVCFPDRDTDFFDIIARVLQGDTLVTYSFIICQNYLLLALINLIKENGFMLKKARSRWYLAETITDADQADDLVLLVIYTCLSWIPITKPGASSKRHWPPREHK